MKLYLRKTDDALTFSDWADYPGKTTGEPPFPAPSEWEWAEGDLPDGASPETPKAEKLKGLLTQAHTLMKGDPLPAKYRLAVYQLEATADIAFSRQDEEAVKAAIQGFDIPVDPGVSKGQRDTVDGFKAQMLALFQ